MCPWSALGSFSVKGSSVKLVRTTMPEMESGVGANI